MRFKDILLENVVLNATKPVLVPGDHATAQAVESLGLENSLEDWAHNRYSKWVIHVKEANPEWKEFIGSDQVRSWYTGVLVKYILKDKENKFLPMAPPHIHFDKIPHKDEIKGLNWAIENGELNQIRYFPADDGKIHMDLRNQLEEAEHFFSSLMYDIFAQPHIPGNSDEATTKRLMQVHKQQKTNAEKLLKNIARSPMEQLLQQWAKYNQKRPTVKAEQIEDQTKVHEEGDVSFWRLDSENAFKATGSALKNCIGSMYHYKPEEYQIYVLRDKGTEQAAIAIHVGEDSYHRGAELPAVRENKGYNNRPTPAIYTDQVINFFQKMGVKGVVGSGIRDNHSMGLMLDKDGFKNVRKEFPLNKTNITYKLDDTYTVSVPSKELIERVLDVGKELGMAKIKYRTVNKEETGPWREKADLLADQFQMLTDFISKFVDGYKIRHVIDRWVEEQIDRNLKNWDMEEELAETINSYLSNFYTILDSKDRAIIDFRVDSNKKIDRWTVLIDSRAPFLSHVKQIHDGGVIVGVDKEIERQWLDTHGVVKGKKGAYHPYMEKYSPKKIKESGNYTLWRHTGSPGKIDQYWDVNDKKQGRYDVGPYSRSDSFKDIAREWTNRYGDYGVIKMRFYYIGDSSGRPMVALGVGDQKMESERYSWRDRSNPAKQIKNILTAVLVARKPKIRSTEGDHESELIDDPDPERGIIWNQITRSSDIQDVATAFQELLPVPGKIEHLGENFKKLAYMIGWSDTVEETINKDLEKGWRKGRFNPNKAHLGLNTINNNRAFQTLKPATQQKILTQYTSAMKDMQPTYGYSPGSRYRMIKYGASRADVGIDKNMFLSNMAELDPEHQGPSIDIGMNWKGADKDKSHDNNWHIYAKAYDVKKEIYNMMLPKFDQLWDDVQHDIEKWPGAKIQIGQDFATIFAPQIKKWKDNWYVPHMKGLDDNQILEALSTVISPDLGALNWKVEKEFVIKEVGNNYGKLKGKDILPWLELAYEHAKGDVYGPVGQEEAERYNKAMKAWHMGIGGTKHEGPEPGSKANLIEPKAMLKLLIKKFKENYISKLYEPKGWKYVFGTTGKNFKSRITIGSIDHVDELRSYTMGQDDVNDPTYFMGYGHWADRSGEQFLIAKELQKRNPEMNIPGITPEMRERMLTTD